MRIELANKQQPIQLVQLTDTHLGATEGEKLLGMDTDASLKHVLTLIKQQRSKPDLLLATGDISNHGYVSAYTRFRQLTDELARHSLWLPGNHDDPAAMQQVVQQEMTRAVMIGNWQILMLNSAVEGEVGGSFSDEELTFLAQQLNDVLDESRAEHTLVCLHHHPINIGCDWLDAQKVSNADRFFDILDRSDRVRGVLWGHIHQEVDIRRKHTRLLASPSTCIQFAKHSADFKLDRLNPGYRWLELHGDGRIETGVSRVKAVNFNIDYDNATGYE